MEGIDDQYLIRSLYLSPKWCDNTTAYLTIWRQIRDRKSDEWNQITKRAKSGKKSNKKSSRERIRCRRSCANMISGEIHSRWFIISDMQCQSRSFWQRKYSWSLVENFAFFLALHDRNIPLNSLTCFASLLFESIACIYLNSKAAMLFIKSLRLRISVNHYVKRQHRFHEKGYSWEQFWKLPREFKRQHFFFPCKTKQLLVFICTE